MADPQQGSYSSPAQTNKKWALFHRQKLSNCGNKVSICPTLEKNEDPVYVSEIRVLKTGLNSTKKRRTIVLKPLRVCFLSFFFFFFFFFFFCVCVCVCDDDSSYEFSFFLSFLFPLSTLSLSSFPRNSLLPLCFPLRSNSSKQTVKKKERFFYQILPPSNMMTKQMLSSSRGRVTWKKLFAFKQVPFSFSFLFSLFSFLFFLFSFFFFLFSFFFFLFSFFFFLFLFFFLSLSLLLPSLPFTLLSSPPRHRRRVRAGDPYNLLFFHFFFCCFFFRK